MVVRTGISVKIDSVHALFIVCATENSCDFIFGFFFIFLLRDTLKLSILPVVVCFYRRHNTNSGNTIIYFSLSLDFFSISVGNFTRDLFPKKKNLFYFNFTHGVLSSGCEAKGRQY